VEVPAIVFPFFAEKYMILRHLATSDSFLASPPEVLRFAIEPYMDDWDSRNPDSHSLTTQTSKKTLFIAKSGKTPNSTICTLTLMQQVFKVISP
jgi:hypothetical protein